MGNIEFLTEAPTVDAHAWLRLLDGCLTTIAAIARRQGSHDVRVTIGDLKAGSAMMASRIDGADEAVATFISGLEQLAVSDEIPSGMTEDDVKRMNAVLPLTSREGLSDLRVRSNGHRAFINSTVRHNAKRAVEGVARSTGAVIGTLEVLDLHNKRQGKIFDYRDGRAIQVRFPEELRQAIIDVVANRDTVELRGEVYRDRADRVQRIDIDDLDVLRRPMVSVDDLFGSDPNYTGGMDTVEWVRLQRG